MNTYNTLLPDNRHSILHSIYSVRNLAKVVFAHSFLISVERAVVGPCDLKIVTVK